MTGSLYRKYRPQRFDELIGQAHVARALQNALSENRLSHAYLFSGTRGTGKTSTARILGAVLNCEKFKDGYPSTAGEVEPCGVCESCIATRQGNSFDVIELDAASNNGVDDIRELVEKVSYASAAGGKKVYIIDEVHELTGRASNALLKTLEEPPEHVIFILATTNPEKVIATIRSRTQHFEFVSPDEKMLFNHVKDILSREEKELDDEAISFIARKGAGSVRDTLSFLDQVLALEVSTLQELQNINASGDLSIVIELIEAVHQSDIEKFMDCLHQLNATGMEPRAIVEAVISYARDCLVLSLNPNTSVILSQHSNKEELIDRGKKCGVNFLRHMILTLGKSVSDMRSGASLNPLLTVEIALLAAMQTPVSPNGQISSTQDQSDRPSAKFEDGRSRPLATQARPPIRKVGEHKEQDEDKPVKTTLGALKKSQVSTKDSQQSKIQNPKAQTDQSAPKIQDIIDSWPKVLALLSSASRGEIQKAKPVELSNDVLTFAVDESEMEVVKDRFKKDASIVRGFLESIHEVSYRFQIVPSKEVSIVEPDEEIDIREDTDTLLKESKEYDPVNSIVDMFSGEVVSD